MRVLITGGFGFLGGRLAQLLAARAKHDILLGSRHRVAAPDWLPQARVVTTCFSSSASLEQALRGTEAVVHLAGMNAQDCAADPVAALECNAVATGRILQAAIRQRVKRFVHLSTAHVYGSPLAGLITERTCPLSLHPYATSHRAGEDLVRAAHHRKEIEGVVVRLSNAFGAPAHKDANCWMLLANDLCRQAVTTKRLTLRSNGLQRRDFITMTDACRAIAHVLDLPAETLLDGLFNIGGGWSPTLLEISELIQERVFSMTESRAPIELKEDRHAQGIEKLDYRMDKLIASGFALNGPPQVGLEIDRLLRFCLEHFGRGT